MVSDRKIVVREFSYRLRIFQSFKELRGRIDETYLKFNNTPPTLDRFRRLRNPREDHESQHRHKNNQRIELGATVLKVLQSFPGQQRH